MDLKGKRGVVTGATKGIGLAVAKALASRGVRLMLTARSGDDLRRVGNQLAQSGWDVHTAACDVGDPAQVENLMRECEDRLGGLEILINNAGVGVFKPVAELSVQQWRTTISTNLDGVFYCCRFGLPLMKKSGEGFIVNISSLAGKNPFPGGAAYNASKFALTGFSEALMQEVRHDGIRVAYIMPGSVDTWFGGSPPEGEASWKLSAEDVAQVVVETLERHPRCLTSRIEMRPSRPPK